jgi:16S rRNA (guanine(966)-N(2))-methyltransferase RsmD
MRFEGGNVLDCFSGTGSMGLECLSRGAAKAIFIERDRGALKNLRTNIETLGVKERAIVLPIDAYLAGDNPDIANLTIAFVDPPYSHMETGHLRHKVDALVKALADRAMVDGGIISLRHPTRVSVDMAAMGVKVVRELTYGDMGITWLAKA